MNSFLLYRFDLRWSLSWLWLFSLCCVFWLIGRSLDEFRFVGAVYVLSCLLLTLSIESIVIWLFFRLSGRWNFLMPARPWHPVSLIIIGVILFNQRYFLLPVLFASFLFKVMSLLIVGVASFIALYSSHLRRFLVAFAIFLAVMPWLFLIQPRQKLALNNVMPIQFQQSQRNVYLLSFDSLVSKDAFLKLFGYPALPWTETLHQMGFRVFENARAAGDNTLDAFTHILNMQEMALPIPRADFFGGYYDNPGYQLFKNNLYGVQFFFQNSYFGYKTGHWIDYFYPPRSINVCEFISPIYGFFVCKPVVMDTVNQWLGFSTTEHSVEEMEKNLTKRISVITDTLQRWLTIAYFLGPGHTPNLSSYHYKDAAARQAYIEQYLVSASKTIGIMQRIITQIQNQDKNAVIIVFGDHGAWITRGLDEQAADAQQRELIRLDRRGVTFAVFPSNYCANNFIENYDLTQLLRDVASCLAFERN